MKGKTLTKKDRRAIQTIMHPMLPEGTSGNMEIEHRDNADGTVDYFGTRVRYPFKFEVLRDTSLEAETFGKMVWMSTTPQEVYDHIDAIDNFPDGGSLFMSGLGLGLAIRMIEERIKRDEDVINLVWPHVVRPQYRLIHAEIGRFLATDGALHLARAGKGMECRRYDLVILDTWPDGDYLYLPWAERLNRLASPLKKPDGHVMLWAYDRMIDTLQDELWHLFDLFTSPNMRDRWHTVRKGIGEQWPYFLPFLDSVYALKMKPDMKEQVRNLVDCEIEEFKKGHRDGTFRLGFNNGTSERNVYRV
jgi:hypothetical protein